MAISKEQYHVIAQIEVSTAVISLFTTGVFIAAFWRYASLRTPSNTLIFYASFSNIFANVAATMGSGQSAHNRGARCQAQAFLIEWFMQADPLWSAAMAVNVYLCIFWRYDAARLKNVYWVYTLVCYGVPFIPAMFCLFYREGTKGKVYGNAQLWCWIKNEYSGLRVWTFYIPIWISILISLLIYARVGAMIIKVRRDLKSINQSREDISTSDSQSSRAVLVVDDSIDEKIDFPQMERTSISTSRPRLSTTSTESPQRYRTKRFDSIDAMMLSHPIQAPRLGNSVTIYSEPEEWQGRATQSISSPPGSCSCSPLDPVHSHTIDAQQINSMAPRKLSTSKTQTNMQRLQWAYAKSALLFTISVLITWIPPSIHRVRYFTHPGLSPSFHLLAVSAAVLPLQGFWNSVIFVVGSWSVIKSGWNDWRQRRNPHVESRV